jgi:hypothetical protein
MKRTGKRITFVCETCGGKNVTRDAWAAWDEDSQHWALAAIYDYAYCHDCESETRLTDKTLRARRPRNSSEPQPI